MKSSRPFRAILAGAAALAAHAASGEAAAQAKPKVELPPAPLSVQVIAPTPDPPWTLRIDNEGDRPVRLPADVRLLSFEIRKPGKNAAWRACRPAAGQKPSSFPSGRAIYLQPGESWVEKFDPRLFCFGAEGDLLRGGTLVRTRFGFGKQGWATDREPFAAQSTDEPLAFASTRELSAPMFLLGYAPAEIAPIAPTPLHATHANEPLEKAPPPPPPPPSFHAEPRADGRAALDLDHPEHDPDHPARDLGRPGHDRSAAGEAGKSSEAGKSGEAGKPEDTSASRDAARPGDAGEDTDEPKNERARGPRTSAQQAHDEAIELEKQRAKEREAEREKELRERYVDETIGLERRDRQAPDLDLYVDGWADGSAPRDVTLRMHARNEGGRKLAAVLRTRMIRFRVEGPLTPQNQTPATVECILDERTHGVPVEMVRDYRPGERLDVPFLLAEVCPRGTFDRPGLYRVTPLLVSQIEGEAVQHREAFQGRVRALQPALARIGVSRLPFYDAPPRTMKTRHIGLDPDEIEEESKAASAASTSGAPGDGDPAAGPATSP